MSIQRYAVIETALCIGGNLHEGEVLIVRADEHDREMAALREEHGYLMATKPADPEELQQRLTAAEQRNTELVGLLLAVLDEVPHGWGQSFSESELAERIRSAIPLRHCVACDQYVDGPCNSLECTTPEVENWSKLTESGASE